jgi:hypothetical protein
MGGTQSSKLFDYLVRWLGVTRQGESIMQPPKSHVRRDLAGA